MGAGAHGGADLAAQLDGGATLGLVAGPGDLDELAGAAGGVADRDGLVLAGGATGDGAFDVGHTAGQRVGDDVVRHVGLAVEAVDGGVVLGGDLVGHVDVLGGGDGAGFRQEGGRLGRDRDAVVRRNGRVAGGENGAGGEGGDGGDRGAAGGDAARRGEGEHGLEGCAGRDGAQVVGDEAVGRSGGSLDLGGDNLVASGRGGVDTLGGRVGVGVAAGGDRVRQGDGHDRVEAVLRGGGPGKHDDVALFDARQVHESSSALIASLSVGAAA